MKKNYTEYGTQWTTISIYVDINTGEQIKKKTAKKEYILINKNKHYEVNKSKSQGRTTITNECRPNPQGKLW